MSREEGSEVLIIHSTEVKEKRKPKSHRHYFEGDYIIKDYKYPGVVLLYRGGRCPICGQIQKREFIKIVPRRSNGKAKKNKRRIVG